MRSGQTGHLSADCPKPQQPKACHLCGKEGHSARFCRGRTKNVDKAQVEALVARRNELRAAGEYEGADGIKAELKALGVTVVDADGTWTIGKRKKGPKKQAT